MGDSAMNLERKWRPARIALCSVLVLFIAPPLLAAADEPTARVWSPIEVDGWPEIPPTFLVPEWLTSLLSCLPEDVSPVVLQLSRQLAEEDKKTRESGDRTNQR